MGRPPLDLDRDERRWRARQNGETPAAAGLTVMTCLCCYGPVPAGEVACSEQCDSIWYGIIPAADGELYIPPQSLARRTDSSR